MSETPYNPLDKKNLGISVADAMLARPVSPLPPGNRFAGAGIYAIYYVGNFPAYAPIAERNRAGLFDAPIHVGKAIPAGTRRGGGLGVTTGPVLFRRLSEHAQSIDQAMNLDRADFFCRYLVVDDIWIPLGESLLIERFAPVWNSIVDGFGNHDPGSGRYNSQGNYPIEPGTANRRNICFLHRSFTTSGNVLDQKTLYYPSVTRSRGINSLYTRLDVIMK